MAVFHIYNKESKEFLERLSKREQIEEPLPNEIQKYFVQYIEVLFSCGRSHLIPWYENDTKMGPLYDVYDLLEHIDDFYQRINSNFLSSGKKWYPIRIDFQPYHTPLIAWEELKGRNIDGRDFLLLDNAVLTRMSYPNEEGKIIEKKFRIPQKMKRSKIQCMYKKHSFPIWTNGKNKTSVLIETKDPIWNNGFTIKIEFKNNKMSLTCPEINDLEKPNVEIVGGRKRINWMIKNKSQSEFKPQLTSIQQAYYIYFLEHNSFPLSKENDENRSKFVDDIIAIYKPIEENKTAEQEHHKSCENTIKKYQKFKETKNEGALLKEIRDTIYEMNAEIERISPFLIIRKEDLEVNSSQYIIPLEWLKKSF